MSRISSVIESDPDKWEFARKMVFESLEKRYNQIIQEMIESGEMAEISEEYKQYYEK